MMDRMYIILGLKATSDVERVINRIFHRFGDVNKLSHIASEDILLGEAKRTLSCMLIK